MAKFNHPVGNLDYTQSTVVIIGAGISGSYQTW
jgi:cation diffusion facilitator CzcD-associated flavoprotein CzcO